MRKGKSPARKFTKRRFSAERVKRISAISEEMRRKHAGYFAEIKYGSISLLNYLRGRRNAVTIFVGQGMRPFFETVRVLNTVLNSVPKNEIVYIIPPRDYHIGEQRKAAEQKIIELLSRKSVKRGAQEYFLIDHSFRGPCFRLFEGAINKINPQARVNLLNQRDVMVGTAVSSSEGCSRPTIKLRGTRLSANLQQNRDLYLFFQHLLQQEIEKM